MGAGGGCGGGRGGRHGSKPLSGILGQFFLEPEQDWTDGELVAREKARFFEQAAVDAHAIAAAEIANQHSIICCCDTTVAAGDLGPVEADIALRVAADQEDRTIQGDDRAGTLYEWDDAE